VCVVDDDDGGGGDDDSVCWYVHIKAGAVEARRWSWIPWNKEHITGAGEMAQPLWALTALPKKSSIPSNHMVAHNHL